MSLVLYTQLSKDNYNEKKSKIHCIQKEVNKGFASIAQECLFAIDSSYKKVIKNKDFYSLLV